jgi:hypothetical protein
MRWAGYVTCVQNFCQKTSRDNKVERLSQLWTDDIKMDLRKIRCKGKGVYWIHLAPVWSSGGFFRVA